MEYIISSDIAATIAILAYVGLVFAAGVSDILTLTIPNRFSAAILLLYPSYVLSSGQPIDWQGGFLIAFGAPKTDRVESSGEITVQRPSRSGTPHRLKCLGPAISSGLRPLNMCRSVLFGRPGDILEFPP